MSKAQQTKTRIIQEAANLFNQKGYAASSISDIMKATGLKKGGIYNHFQSKDELALAAFDYAVDVVTQKLWHTVEQEKNAITKLKTLVAVHLEYMNNPPLPGGCPIMNTAIEWDDIDATLQDLAKGEALRNRAEQAMKAWQNLIVTIVETGIQQGEIKAHIKSDHVATILISTIEGAIMMSQLFRDSSHLERVVNNLHNYLDDITLI